MQGLLLLLLISCSPAKKIEKMPAPPVVHAEKREPALPRARKVEKEPQVVSQAMQKNLDNIVTAMRAVGGHYKVGKPFKINGVWYFPKENWTYDEIGQASWYGDDFHGKRTANGEIFDKNKITAAHRTLPLPCIVRVTNLENGISLLIRVNDRGPFAKDRIIDLSYAAARMLRFDKHGMARVRVQILPEESRKLKEKLLGEQKQNVSSEPDMIESTTEKVKGFFQKLMTPPEEKDFKTVQKGDSYVQVATFHEENDAKRLFYKIQTYQQLPVFIKEERRKTGALLYSVIIGPLSHTQALSSIQMLKRKYKIYGAYVVKK